MVSTHQPSDKSSSPFSNPLVTVPNAPITIGIIVTCMFHSFFNSLVRSRYLSFFSHSSVLFCGQQYYYYYYYFTPSEFFMPGNAGGLSQKFERQQVSSGPLDSSRYYSRFQQCCSMRSFDSPTDFQFFQSFLQIFWDRSERINYNWYYFDPHISQIFQFSVKIQVFV